MRWALAAILVVIVAVAVGLYLIAYKPAIDPLPEGQVASFDAELVARGEQLAMLGNCASCHAAPGGEAYAGGLAIPTPFGTVYSTNITPAPDTGIGRWTEAAFRRALHEGVDREGNHLYPAFPYDHFTHVSDDDVATLYAYFMTRRPVEIEPPDNELFFPINLRPVVAGWKLLFLRAGPLPDVAGQSDQWLRGYYLVEGLGHCSGCHTPRNALGAEDGNRYLDGADNIEGWYAYPLNETSPASSPWTVEQMTQYLRAGFSEAHGTARGPMTQVTHNLREVSPEDAEAIAVYVVSQMQAQSAGEEPAPPATPPLQSGDSQAVPQVVEAGAQPGAVLYAAACSSCHEAGRPQPFGGLDLRRSTAVNAETPRNLVNMVLFGLPAGEDEPTPVMPGYAGAISEDHLVALIDYIRATFSPDRPAWSNTRDVVARTMRGETMPIIYSTDGVRRAPVAATPRATP